MDIIIKSIKLGTHRIGPILIIIIIICEFIRRTVSASRLNLRRRNVMLYVS